MRFIKIDFIKSYLTKISILKELIVTFSDITGFDDPN